MQADLSAPVTKTIEEEWHTVSFSRRKPSSPWYFVPPAFKKKSIKVRIFDADTCKFLNTKNLKYINKDVSGKIGYNKNPLHSHKLDPNLNILEKTNQFTALQIQPTDNAKTTSSTARDSDEDQCMEFDLEPLSNVICHVADVPTHSLPITFTNKPCLSLSTSTNPTTNSTTQQEASLKKYHH